MSIPVAEGYRKGPSYLRVLRLLKQSVEQEGFIGFHESQSPMGYIEIRSEQRYRFAWLAVLDREGAQFLYTDLTYP